MKKEVVLIIALFLIIFMVGGVGALQRIDYGIKIQEVTQKSNCLLIETEEMFDTQIQIGNKQNENIQGLCFNWFKERYPDEEEIIKVFANGIYLTINGKTYSTEWNYEMGHSNYEGYEFLKPVSSWEEVINEMMNRSSTTLYVVLKSPDNSIFTGLIYVKFDNEWENWNNLGLISIDGFIIEDNEEKIEGLEQRVSSLESWKQTIDEWKNTVTISLSDILLSITGLTTRIATLENSSCDGCNETQEGAGTWNNFKKYITSSTRKKMVCDYAEENRLTGITELGYNCSLGYTNYSSGKERVTCRCDKV